MRYTRFEWDQTKSRRNLRKHGVSFDSAALLFDRPHLVRLDTRAAYDEDRWTAIGWMGPIVGLVVFTERPGRENESVIRIISARKASRRERRAYEAEIQGRT